ncbi:MAG: SIMPL domain-containing protein [Saprospiraceae bacterium]|nr:SIMPL domain-containing protein [Saprospiraceae bacterium]
MSLRYTIWLLLIADFAIGQVSGNVNYSNRVQLGESNISVNFNSNSDLIIKVKGLNNVHADHYVAMFNISQKGETIEQTHQLLEERIKQVSTAIKNMKQVELVVDMVSFAPQYAYEKEKKVFSKKSYNEIPVGFELQKNLHLKYEAPNQLTELVRICSENEIYDLIGVDYIANDIKGEKKKLMDQADLIVQEKLDRYEKLLSIELDSLEKELVDGFRIIYPVESYKSYQAYSSSSLNEGESSRVNQSQKRNTLYYRPIVNKEFDFVINPVVVEPVIQVLYELRIKIKQPKIKQAKPEKEYMIILPKGEVKKIDIGN